MRPRTQIGICTHEDFYLPISGQAIVMEKQRNRVCGADIHKKFLVATIISRDGIKIAKRFGMTLEDLLEFKSWVVENHAASSYRVHWSLLDSDPCSFRGYSRFDSRQRIQD
jgi:hypothetical protein